ncbi:N-terminal methylation [Nautilia profundicola AmH]|uniref:N-terminal methylation n=1 Tax=Nautilia profundicola (strain ATCC BAA-1463 / DSM 18972 / AmH) TaxID=598659 RepID=B9L918_NAUPA|nr:prepilin-type N-terminal cleavage/methylation domain-containing protein [Nautilia profundicola]ACM93468.1 N-terminal methylation [Nautilia profundicola AmH]
MTSYTKLTKQKNYNFSSAFTMIELLVVIIIIGIIVATLSFNFSPNRLQLATDQLIKDIKFTQSLALKDDKYQPFPKSSSSEDQNQSKYWFKQWWQLRIGRTTNGNYFYEIFSDSVNSSNIFDKTANPLSEVALDPQTKKYLTGNYSANTDEDLNLSKMGISIIKDDNNNTLTSGSIRFVFDNVGNVYLDEGTSGDTGDINPFDTGRHLLTHNYKLRLCSDNNCNNCIAIEISPSGNVEQTNCN